MTTLATTSPDLQAYVHDRGPTRVSAFQSFFERSGMCMVSVDPHLRVHEANEEFCHEFGHSRDDTRGTSLLAFVHSSGRDMLRRQLARVADGSRARVTERMLGLRSGTDVFSGQLTAIGIDEVGAERNLVVVVDVDESLRRRVKLPGKRLLSSLDAQILEGIAAGATTVALASRFYLSRQGIEYHVSTMLRKLRAPNRAALVSRAYSLGVFEVGTWPPQVLPDMVE